MLNPDAPRRPSMREVSHHPWFAMPHESPPRSPLAPLAPLSLFASDPAGGATRRVGGDSLPPPGLPRATSAARTSGPSAGVPLPAAAASGSGAIAGGPGAPGGPTLGPHILRPRPTAAVPSAMDSRRTSVTLALGAVDRDRPPRSPQAPVGIAGYRDAPVCQPWMPPSSAGSAAAALAAAAPRRMPPVVHHMACTTPTPPSIVPSPDTIIAI